MNIELRDMTEEDVSSVYKIAVDSFVTTWSKEQFLFQMQQSYVYSVVASIDSKIVGYCYLSILADEGEILDIAVDSEYRNQHIGETLLLDALNKAKEKKVSSVFLEVSEKNKAAITLYEKVGFTVVSVRKNYYSATNEDAYNMQNLLL